MKWILKKKIFYYYFKFFLYHDLWYNYVHSNTLYRHLHVNMHFVKLVLMSGSAGNLLVQLTDYPSLLLSYDQLLDCLENYYPGTD